MAVLPLIAVIGFVEINTFGQDQGGNTNFPYNSYGYCSGRTV